MKELTMEIRIQVFRPEELPEEDRELIQAARAAAQNSYSPYSHFAVGAALRLDNGCIVSGSNQENAAHPSGMCAERTALFYAGARYPNHCVTTLAIDARHPKGWTSAPVPPCGACRQVMLETEQRSGRPMRLLLSGSEQVYVIAGIRQLLPLQFGQSFLE